MKTQTTPFPAAATCAVVGSGIGVLDGRTDAVAVGVGVAAGVCVAVALVVGIGLPVGVDAAGAHAAMRRMKRTMGRNSWFFTFLDPPRSGTSCASSRFPAMPVC